MLKHFKNLSTPLKSVEIYPTLVDQENRFRRAGWSEANAKSLWDVWQDPSFLTWEERIKLNEIEPFDEWEEFMLFASHYFVLEASNSSGRKHPTTPLFKCGGRSIQENDTVDDGFSLHATSRADDDQQRKFGAIVVISESVLGYYGGVGNDRRLNKFDKFTLEGVIDDTSLQPPIDIQPRMCHTITSLERGKCLMIGGRTSPYNALFDCWLISAGKWERADSLPLPLYRHCATHVEFDEKGSGVLVFGGKTTRGVVVNKWLLWRETTGWLDVTPSVVTEGRFGAAIVATGHSGGLVLGGMTADGLLCNEVLEWSLDYEDRRPSIQITYHNIIGLEPRLGSCLAWSSIGLLLIGGISRSLTAAQSDILCLSRNTGPCEEPLNLYAQQVDILYDGPKPLLVGHAAQGAGNSIFLVGGGAVCFSFGKLRRL